MSEPIPTSPYLLATIFARPGEEEQALTWLERAYSSRSIELVGLKVSPAFDSLRSNADSLICLEECLVGQRSQVRHPDKVKPNDRFGKVGNWNPGTLDSASELILIRRARR